MSHLIIIYGSQFLVGFGILSCFYYVIKLIFRAFKAHFLWGIGFPFIGFIFIFKRWDLARQPVRGFFKSVFICIIGILFLKYFGPLAGHHSSGLF